MAGYHQSRWLVVQFLFCGPPSLVNENAPASLLRCEAGAVTRPSSVGFARRFSVVSRIGARLATTTWIGMGRGQFNGGDVRLSSSAGRGDFGDSLQEYRTCPARGVGPLRAIASVVCSKVGQSGVIHFPFIEVQFLFSGSGQSASTFPSRPSQRRRPAAASYSATGIPSARRIPSLPVEW